MFFFFLLYRRWLPNFNQVCSADLLQHKVLVPCDPVEYLNLEYGEANNWIFPKSKNYTWSNLDKQHTNWTDKEWPHAIKFYNINGFNKIETINFVNNYLKKKITKLPIDDI